MKYLFFVAFLATICLGSAAQDIIKTKSGESYSVKILSQDNDKIRYVIPPDSVIKEISRKYVEDVYKQIMPIDPATGQVVYTGVVEVTGKTAKQLYSSAKSWIASSYKSAKKVTDLDDPEAGKIIIKPIMNVTVKHMFGSDNNSWVSYTLSISVKDGKFKYVVTDFYHEGDTKDGSGGSLNNEKATGTLGDIIMFGNWNKVKAQVNENIAALIESLKKGMEKQAENESW